MKQILVLCAGNSCRSQMAEGYLKKFAGDKAMIYSAGIQAHGVNPRAIEVMKQDQIDISGHSSNNIDEYSGINFDYVITVCDHARENCPYLKTDGVMLHQNFPDPAIAVGTDKEVLKCFVDVRNWIKTYTQNFVLDYLK